MYTGNSYPINQTYRCLVVSDLKDYVVFRKIVIANVSFHVTVLYDSN